MPPLQIDASDFCIVVSTTASPADSITTTAKFPTVSKVELLIVLFIMRLSVIIVYYFKKSRVLYIYIYVYSVNIIIILKITSNMI